METLFCFWTRRRWLSYCDQKCETNMPNLNSINSLRVSLGIVNKAWTLNHLSVRGRSIASALRRLGAQKNSCNRVSWIIKFRLSRPANRRTNPRNAQRSRATWLVSRHFHRHFLVNGRGLTLLVIGHAPSADSANWKSSVKTFFGFIYTENQIKANIRCRFSLLKRLDGGDTLRKHKKLSRLRFENN